MKNKSYIKWGLFMLVVLLGSSLLIYIMDTVWDGYIIDWFANHFINQEFQPDGSVYQYLNIDALRRFLRYTFFILLLLVITALYWMTEWRVKKEKQKQVHDIAEQMQFFIQQEGAAKLSKEYALVEKELVQLNWKLQKKEQEYVAETQKKNDLVAYLAHDMKTPLASVIGYLTLLKEVSKLDEEHREKYLSITLDKAERLEMLLEEFFEISRFNIHTLFLQKQKVSLSMLFQQLQEEFYPSATMQKKEIQIRCHIQDEVYLDGEKMARVFNNILKNALAYSDEGSLITITAQRENGFLKIMFTNQGANIPIHKLEQIFEQFYRLDGARSSQQGGSGLGLAIAKAIVEAHDGTIEATSENRETTFTIVLPQS